MSSQLFVFEVLASITQPVFCANCHVNSLYVDCRTALSNCLFPVIQLRFHLELDLRPGAELVGSVQARHFFPTMGFLSRSATFHSVLLSKCPPKKVAAGVLAQATSNDTRDIPTK
jgi:hypothetical protein